MPALGWNLSRIHQFAYRIIRMDSEEPSQMHFVTYANSIETNLWQLLMSKEVGNMAVAEGRVPTTEEISQSLEIDPQLLQNILGKERDEEGNLKLTWVSNLVQEATGAAA